MKILDQLLNAGINQSLDDSTTKEKRTFNTFLIGSIIIVIPLLITSIVASKSINVILCAGAISFLGILFLAALGGYYSLSKHLFLYLCLSIICFGTYHNFTLLRFNGIEYLLFPLLLSSALLFKSRSNILHTFLIISSLVILSIMKRKFEALPFDNEFAIRLVLSLMIAIAIIILTQIYRFNERRLLEKMTRQKDILYALIDHVPVMMSLIDRDKRFQMVNKPFADFLGISREKLLGSACEDGFPKAMVARHKNWCMEAVENGPISFDDELSQDNKRLSFTGRYVPIKDRSGKVQFISQHLVDISELKKIAASLEEANDAKNKLLSMLAHDIRSPLAMLSSIMQLDKNNELTKEQFLYFKDDINDKLKNLLTSLDTVLDWSRYQLDGIRTQKTAFSLHDVVNECINQHFDYARLKHINIILNNASNELVWADLNHMRLILKNLIHNAIKFSVEGQDVTITISEEADGVSLVISDHGIGMDDKRRKSILSGSIQDSLSGTSDEKGNGLGLSLSLGLAKLNNLQFELTSKKGEGTRIGILIPVAIHA